MHGKTCCPVLGDIFVASVDGRIGEELNKNVFITVVRYVDDDMLYLIHQTNLIRNIH